MSAEKETPGQVNFVVGIGASADGIPTLEKLFEQLPANTNMSFVVIQHLSPNHESILDQILQRKTGMKVLKITPNMKLEPNCVFIPPVGHYLGVANDKFEIRKYKSGEQRLNLPIDYFFRSLANSYKEMAVGVLLTGSGSDGSQGIKEIKQNSGWVIVQEPGSAGYESMPRHAIETGVADIVCTIDAMPDKLAELPTKHDGIKKLPEDEETEKIVTEILLIMQENTRHDFSSYKRSTVLRRIKKRMMVRSLMSMKRYFEVIKQDKTEALDLLKELLIGVTSFFRDKNAYEALEKKVISELVSAAGPNEEAQSTNEELQSANEKLETSKEEMQSLNEELETSNAELQRKIKEYSEVNNDLANFMRNTQIGTLFLDKELKIQRFTSQVKEIINLNRTDEGRSIGDFSIKFDGKALEAEAAEVLEYLTPVQREIELANGRQYWMLIKPYRTLEDIIRGVVVTFTDITEQNKIQRLIKAKDEKFRNLFRFMDNGLAVYEVESDSNRKIKSAKLAEANPAFAQMMKLSLKDILNKEVSETFPDSNMVADFMKFAPKVLDGKTVHKEYYFKSLNRYFHIHSFSSEPGQVAMLIQDVTQDKKEVIKYRRHLASIVEASEDAIFSTSPNGKILWWNNGAEALYGYNKNETIDKKADELISLPGQEEFSNLISMVLEGKRVKGFETIHLNKSGKSIPVAITMSAIRDDEDKVTAISNIVQDISPIRQREEEYIKARAETEKAARAKSAFLSNMSHEIRTPLNSILGFTGILKDLTNDEKHNHILDTISESGNQLLNLINDIIDVSRIEAGELKIAVENVALNEFMKRIEEQFKGIIHTHEKQNLKFRLLLPDGEYVIQTDHFRLQQILHNLISNAFKFTSKGKVEFGYEINDDAVLFFVKDTGSGITEENQQFLFERFSQGEIHPENAIKGTGLGLTICKGIVEMMGGKIWLESEKGKGTSVYFTLPYLEGINVSENTTEHLEDSVPDLTGKTVLIVEDDDFSREMLKYLVEKTGAKIVIAQDGEEAISRFTGNKVDLVLLDIRLPKKNGYEVLQYIRRQNPHVPVIAETAHAMRKEVLNFTSLGFNNYLVKPIAKEELYRVLQKHVAKVPENE